MRIVGQGRTVLATVQLVSSPRRETQKRLL